MQQNLLDFDAHALAGYFTEMGEKPFRARQLMRWIYREGESDFAAMTDISAALRGKLAQRACIAAPDVLREELSDDGTRKWLLNVGTGNAVEAVFIPEETRGTLCVSTQAGCALDCAFCSTGKQGFNRNLSVAEIIGQLWWANHELGKGSASDTLPRSGRLREEALAALPAPDGSAAPCCGRTLRDSPRTPPSSSEARLASTSLMFILLCVPDPVCQTDNGNSSRCWPASTSSAACTMAVAFSSLSNPRSRLTSAAARFTAASARMSSRGICSVEIWKYCKERCVCAPHRRSAGTSIGPKESRSVLLVMVFSSL